MVSPITEPVTRGIQLTSNHKIPKFTQQASFSDAVLAHLVSRQRTQDAKSQHHTRRLHNLPAMSLFPVTHSQLAQGVSVSPAHWGNPYWGKGYLSVLLPGGNRSAVCRGSEDHKTTQMVCFQFIDSPLQLTELRPLIRHLRHWFHQLSLCLYSVQNPPVQRIRIYLSSPAYSS